MIFGVLADAFKLEDEEKKEKKKKREKLDLLSQHGFNICLSLLSHSEVRDLKKKKQPSHLFVCFSVTYLLVYFTLVVVTKG